MYVCINIQRRKENMETKQAETANPRQQRGLQIAKTCQITKTEHGWKVPSQSGAGYYTVESNGFGAKCTCPDHETRRCKCKHIFAVEYIVTGEVNAQGQITITQTVRKTYAQNWPAYNLSQQTEKGRFMELLADVTNGIKQPEYSFGRPTLPSARWRVRLRQKCTRASRTCATT